MDQLLSPLQTIFPLESCAGSVNGCRLLNKSGVKRFSCGVVMGSDSLLRPSGLLPLADGSRTGGCREPFSYLDLRGNFGVVKGRAV